MSCVTKPSHWVFKTVNSGRDCVDKPDHIFLKLIIIMLFVMWICYQYQCEVFWKKWKSAVMLNKWSGIRLWANETMDFDCKAELCIAWKNLSRCYHFIFLLYRIHWTGHGWAVNIKIKNWNC